MAFVIPVAVVALLIKQLVRITSLLWGKDGSPDCYFVLSSKWRLEWLAIKAKVKWQEIQDQTNNSNGEDIYTNTHRDLGFEWGWQ